MTRIRQGQRLPDVTLAKARGTSIEEVQLVSLLAGRRVVVVGLPGAFTPVCTGLHLPALVEAAPSLKASGFQEIVCVAPNSPWVVEEWAGRVDPGGQLTFLSDGNLELARGAGLSCKAPQLFLGECSQRFTLVVESAVVTRIAVEAKLDLVTCTSPEHFVN